MTSLGLLTTDDLHHLAVALRSGRLFPPFSAIQLKPFVPATVADTLAGELRQKFEAGFLPGQLADFFDLLSQDRRRRPVADDLIDLVWTGPEAAGIVNRDTAVVVRELFQHARESVLVAGYAVYQGHVVFKALADRMDQISALDVRMFLDIHRQSHAAVSTSEAVRQFADHFARHQWPGKRLPAVYYDPRSLEAEPSKLRKPSCQVHRCRPRGGLRIVGKFHGSRTYPEHRGWRVAQVSELCATAIRAFRNARLDAGRQAGPALRGPPGTLPAVAAPARCAASRCDRGGRFLMDGVERSLFHGEGDLDEA